MELCLSDSVHCTEFRGIANRVEESDKREGEVRVKDEWERD